MIAVTDTSPICYLILIGEVELLAKLFKQVLVPCAVIAELLHEGAPEAVRAWASHLPSWIAVRESPAGNTTGMEKLQSGERGLSCWHNRSKPISFLSTRNRRDVLRLTAACG